MTLNAVQPRREGGNKIVTGLAILSFPVLATPEYVLGSKDATYGASFIFPPAGYKLTLLNGEVVEFDGATASILEEVLYEVFAAQWPGPANLAKLKASFTTPNPMFKWGIRKDAELKGYPTGSVYINARRKEKQGRPGLVLAHADATGKPAVPAEDQITQFFYPGAIVRAAIGAFAYDMDVSKGVSFGLQNVQHLASGPRMDGRRAATDEFNAVMDASTPADLSDVGVTS